LRRLTLPAVDFFGIIGPILEFFRSILQIGVISANLKKL